MALMLGLGNSGRAHDFYVTNETELRTALKTAASNGQDDAINIAAGLYNTSGSTFDYIAAAGENHSLIIAGAGVENTILDGANSEQVAYIATFESNANISVEGITFQHGESSGDGGGLGVFADRAKITIRDSMFKGSTASDFGGGAMLWSDSGTVTLTRNTFIGNSADNGGGACASSGGDVVFTYNAFCHNIVSGDGGGAYAGSFSGNVTITNNTFHGNSAPGGNGGGLYVSLFDDIAIADICNNIIWHNHAHNDETAGSDLYVEDDVNGNGTGAKVNFYHNDLTGFNIHNGRSLSKGGNINEDPKFIDVSDPDPSNWDLNLQAVSPCIDAGKDTGVDMGAFEDRVTPAAPSGEAGGGGSCFIATAAYGKPSGACREKAAAFLNKAFIEAMRTL